MALASLASAAKQTAPMMEGMKAGMGEFGSGMMGQQSLDPMAQQQRQQRYASLDEMQKQREQMMAQMASMFAPRR